MRIVKSICSYLNSPCENRIVYLSVPLALLLSLSGTAQSAVITYTDEGAYLTALAALAFPVSTVHEGFDLAPWGAETAFPTGTAKPRVTNLGITWSPPVADGFVATSTAAGNVHDGSYLMYAVDSGGISHPVPDGYSLAANGFTLHGVGGWFRGNNTKLAFTVDGDPLRVDFTGGQATVLDWTFLGFIENDPLMGFNTVEIRTADELGNELKTFFSDDFTVAAVPLPAALPLFGSGLMAMLGLLGRRRSKRT